MPAEFGPYQKWLGISPREQPPTHYRLLAIDLFEDDQDVIDAAANRQMAYLQELASGPNVKHAQKLLNEIAAARLCLLDGERKAAYDARLKAKASGQTADATTTTATATAPVLKVAKQLPAPARAPATKPREAKQDDAPAIAVSSQVPKFRRPVKKRKKQSPALALVIVGIAVVVGLPTAIFVSRALREDVSSQKPAGTAQVSPSAHRQVQVASNDTSGAAGGVIDVGIPPLAPGLPQPGSDLPQVPDADPRTPNRSPVPEPAPQGPPVAPQPAPPNQKPELLIKAQAALEQNDVGQMMENLRAYLSGQTQAPWNTQAQGLLRQATLATADEKIKKAVQDSLRSMSDEQVRRAAMGQRQLAIRYPVAEIQNPRLRNICTQSIQRHLTSAMGARLNGKPKTPPPAEPKPAEPRPDAQDNQQAAVEKQETPEPQPEPATPVERPSGPADLLAHEGLVKVGGRWSLIEEETLRQHSKTANDLYKKLNDARRTYTSRQRQQLALMKRQVAEEEAKIQSKYEDWAQKKMMLKSDAEALKRFEAEVKQRREKVDAAQAKVTEVDSTILKTREEISEILGQMEETIDLLETNYRVLAEDAEVLAAIEKLGGSLVASTTLRSAQARLKRMQKDLAETDD